MFSFSGLPRFAVFVLANAAGLAALCYFSWLFNAKLGLPYYAYVYSLIPLYLIYLTKAWLRRRAPSLQARHSKSLLSRLGSAECRSALLFGLFALLLSNGAMKNLTAAGGQIGFYSTIGIEGLWQLGNVAYLKKSFAFGDIHQNGFKFPYHIFIYTQRLPKTSSFRRAKRIRRFFMPTASLSKICVATSRLSMPPTTRALPGIFSTNGISISSSLIWNTGSA